MSIYLNNKRITPILGTILPDQTDHSGEFLTTDGTETSWASVPSRNIGEIVVSTIPLTDAGLHLLNGALIQYGSYSAFVEYMADLYENTPVSGYKSNVNIIGSLTNNNGILSGFGTSNYAEIPQQLPLANANSFEFVFKFNYNTSTAIQSIFTERNAAYFSQISISASGELYCQLSNNHSSDNMGSGTGSTTLTNGNTYYVKLSFDGSAYKVYLSSTGEFSGEETEEISITNSAKLLNFNWNIGCSALSGYEQPFTQGTIDLKKSYININGSRWWTGAKAIKPCFCTESEWQQSITDYGVCGKFVYDSTNNTVRLPKITGIIEGTVDVSALGDLVEESLPNITGEISPPYLDGYTDTTWVYGDTKGSFYSKTTNNCVRNVSVMASSTTATTGALFDASRSSSAYQDNAPVQPQTIKAFYYIVIATTTKTDIQVDIDEVATDLNGKADVDLTNCTDVANIKMAGASMPSNKYIVLTLGASGTTYTAPADGYFYINSYCSVDSSLELFNSGINIRIMYRSGTSGNHIIRGIMPARKGDVVYVNYNDTLNNPIFHFNYAVGSESEVQ